MAYNYPPIVPESSKMGEGTDQMKMISMLVALSRKVPAMRSPILDKLAKMFTPAPPKEELDATEDTKPYGQSEYSSLGQPPSSVDWRP